MRNRIWLVAGALSVCVGLMAAAAPAAPQKAQGQQARVGGTVVIAQDQEPRILNTWITEGNQFATTEVVVPLLDAGMRFNNRAVLVPQLMDGQPRVISNRPFRVRFRYKQAARWSDGRPITGADYRFTWQTHMNQRWTITSRAGWEDIRGMQVQGKTVTITFRRPYAGWRIVAAAIPMPSFHLAGRNFDQAFRNDFRSPRTGAPISSGPFLFQSWTRGQQIRLVRNARYWGRNAYLAGLVYRPLPDTNTQFQALRAGEVQLLRPQPQLQIADIRQDNRFRVQSGPEYAWEHLDIQQGERGHPALRQRYVRQALIAGINRPQIANALFRTISPNLPVLQNVVFKPFEPSYRPNWQVHRFNQARAIQLLRGNGCTGGPATPGAGGIYTCPNVGRLSFRFHSTAGNQLRELAFEIMQTQLRSVGIELRNNFGPATNVFGTVLPSGDWDLFLFTWVGSPTSPIFQKNLHACGGDQNYMNYCNQAVTRLLNQVEGTINDNARTTLLNRADSQISADIPTIPLFARPGFVIHRTNVRNILRNPTQASTQWNAMQWWVS